MKQLGLGVMINMLSGNRDSATAVLDSYGKEIKDIKLEKNTLTLFFTDRSKLVLWDDGQSCCEYRYMEADVTDFDYHKGAVLQSLEVADGSFAELDESCYCKDIEFLKITTSKGTFTITNYNEHNGYYGGFSITAKREYV